MAKIMTIFRGRIEIEIALLRAKFSPHYQKKIILFDSKLVLTVYFQKIYSLSVLLLVLFSILEIMDNNSGGAKFTAGSVCTIMFEHICHFLIIVYMYQKA
jgi:hypothetical protein